MSTNSLGEILTIIGEHDEELSITLRAGFRTLSNLNRVVHLTAKTITINPPSVSDGLDTAYTINLPTVVSNLTKNKYDEMIVMSFATSIRSQLESILAALTDAPVKQVKTKPSEKVTPRLAPPPKAKRVPGLVSVPEGVQGIVRFDDFFKPFGEFEIDTSKPTDILGYVYPGNGTTGEPYRNVMVENSGDNPVRICAKIKKGSSLDAVAGKILSLRVMGDVDAGKNVILKRMKFVYHTDMQPGRYSLHLQVPSVYSALACINTLTTALYRKGRGTQLIILVANF